MEVFYKTGDFDRLMKRLKQNEGHQIYSYHSESYDGYNLIQGNFECVVSAQILTLLGKSCFNDKLVQLPNKKEYDKLMEVESPDVTTQSFGTVIDSGIVQDAKSYDIMLPILEGHGVVVNRLESGNYQLVQRSFQSNHQPDFNFEVTPSLYRNLVSSLKINFYDGEDIFENNSLFNEVNTVDLNNMLIAKEQQGEIHRQLMKAQSLVKVTTERVIEILSNSIIGKYVLIPTDKKDYSSNVKVGVISGVRSISSIVISVFDVSCNNKIIKSLKSYPVMSTKDSEVALCNLLEITKEDAQSRIGKMCFENFEKLSLKLYDDED